MVEPLTDSPSTASTTSPAWIPARSAGRVVERRHDHEAAGGAELGAGGEVLGILDVADRHLGADAAEGAGQVAERAVVLLGRHVARVRVAHAVLEHALDGALGQVGRVELVDVLGLEPVVGLAEGLEGRVGRRTVGPVSPPPAAR